MKILVVDDDLFNRQMVGFVLQEAGHECAFAEDGAKGLDIWREFEPDLILMDAMMPVMDGFEAATRIKSEAGQAHIPIVFLTSLADEKSMVRCLEAGDDFLGKPINFVTLQAKIKAHARTLDLHRKVIEQNKELAYFHSKLLAEQEMTLHVMEAALKSSQLDLPGIRSHCSSVSVFNGDLALQQGKQDGGVYLLVGDFTGHGLAASMGSIPVAQAFRTMTARNLPVSVIARELNDILRRFLPPTMFFAVSLLEVNSARNMAEFWGGGLPDGYIVRQGGGIRRVLSSSHMPLGILEPDEFETHTETIALDVEDKIYLLTDGIAESSAKDGGMFGEERLVHFLENPSTDHFENLINTIHDYADDPELKDDISLVEISCAWRGSAQVKRLDNGEQPEAQTLPRVALTMEWQPDQLRDPDPLLLMRQWFSSHAALRNHREIISLVIAELFNNALDHGVLGLASDLKLGEQGFDRYYREREERLVNLEEGFIIAHIEIETTTPAVLRIELKDSGLGCVVGENGVSSDTDNDHAFGRGLGLVKSICREVSFSPDASQVKAILELD